MTALHPQHAYQGSGEVACDVGVPAETAVTSFEVSFSECSSKGYNMPPIQKRTLC
jgi:hypothetical protein